MEELFELFKGTIITYPSYQGVVCGYNDSNFLIAIETKKMDSIMVFKKGLFRIISKDTFIAEEYKDQKYRYLLEDESAIEKQLKKQKYNGSTKEETLQQQTGGSNGETK